MGKADEALAAIDAGLQQSDETDVVQLDPSKCARCQIREPADGADTCQPCREFLLGDRDIDPGVAQRRGCTPSSGLVIIGTLTVPAETGPIHVVVEQTVEEAADADASTAPDWQRRIYELIAEGMHVTSMSGLRPSAVSRSMGSSTQVVDGWRPPLAHPDAVAEHPEGRA